MLRIVDEKLEGITNQFMEKVNAVSIGLKKDIGNVSKQVAKSAEVHQSDMAQFQKEMGANHDQMIKIMTEKFSSTEERIRKHGADNRYIKYDKALEEIDEIIIEATTPAKK